ncbi:uncharacterized protein N7477_005712 [Penicillium maclennaniae]|uniref:uncharacterized protein n=1 Tax=Penicillium maclennaniae TaxID=1343394 RepID=UPI002541454D|nr:uncharacterized protein N7477_005712 [Penicillium maclennaniae]KAJ5670349.1 hypothetical protein N7477_005712 [Penicillium maclennaniae]
MYTEQILRDKLESVGADYFPGYECVDFQCDENKSSANQPAIVTHYETANTLLAWMVVEVLFVDMQAFLSKVTAQMISGAIESKTHGNVLWAPLDHAATRIGYAYTSDIAAKYPGGITQDITMQEAVESTKPFNVKFKEVHWWTLYQIGQRIAKDFLKGRIFLCGDAAHTHSSGAAQGLNTGIHDAVNLGWKLAPHLRGIVQENILDTYDLERKNSVQQLIDFDRDISILMSRKWPSWYEGDTDADLYIVLGEIFERAASFNTGLGISYPINDINQFSPDGTAVAPGSRPPDVELTTPGTKQTVKLQRVTRNLAKFWVIVFAGNPDLTHASLVELARFLGTFEKFNSREAIGWLTVCGW